MSAPPATADGRVLQVQGTRLFQLVWDFLFEEGDFAPGGRIGPKRIIGLQGGTRSGKTYGVNQVFAVAPYDERAQARGWEFETVRKSLATLRRTAMKEYFGDVLDEGLGIYDPAAHHKTQFRYRVGGCELGWLGADQAQKLRGNKRHVLYANECNELSDEDQRQLFFRTSDKIILDWNPDEVVEWMERVMRRPDAHLDISTYLDNPFVSPNIVQEIETMAPVYEMPSGLEVTDWDLTISEALATPDPGPYEGAVLINGDPDAWRVWGLGLEGKHKAAIYPDFRLVDEVPEDVEDTVYGLDFGFTAPCALVEVSRRDVVGRRAEIYWRELVYERGLSNEDLIERMKEAIPEEHRHREIYCDHEGARILALQNAGFNAVPANKSSVQEGIVTVRGHTLCITKDSPNILKERRAYKRKVDPRTGKVLEAVVKGMDHTMDAGRYGTHSRWGAPEPQPQTRVVEGDDWNAVAADTPGFITVEDW